MPHSYTYIELITLFTTYPTWVIATIVAGLSLNVLAIIAFFIYHKNKAGLYVINKKNRELERQTLLNQQSAEKLQKLSQEFEQLKQQLSQQEAALKTKENELILKEREREATDQELQWQLETSMQLNEQAQSQKRDLDESIQYAFKLQTSLLPQTASLNEILNDYAILYMPRDIVSGDFYWVKPVKGKTVVAVADCTGHGVPGALMSVLGITSLNDIVKASADLSANQILDALRTRIITTLQQSLSEHSTKDGMDMGICIIDWGNERIDYAGANIPLYLIRESESGQPELTELKPDHMPIGIHTNMDTPFSHQMLSITSGDVLYMMSDGYCDQFGGPNLKKYMRKNLKKQLLDIYKHSMNIQKDKLLKTLKNYKGDLDQVDDILVMGIKI